MNAMFFTVFLSLSGNSQMIVLFIASLVALLSTGL